MSDSDPPDEDDSNHRRTDSNRRRTGSTTGTATADGTASAAGGPRSTEAVFSRRPPLDYLLPVPVVADAWRIARPLAVAGAALLVFLPPVGAALLALALATLWFHRDPDRYVPSEGIVSPADGTVSTIREEGDRLRVGVFMDVTDVHVTRAPADTTVGDVRHRPGGNRPAFSKDSDRNEQVTIDCGDYEVILIAGWFARRIHPWIETDEDVDRGQRIGHVSFGSRADVVLPPEIDRGDLLVIEGDDVFAGESLLVAGEER